MTYFDYKVVPAPRRTKKVKGVKTPEELFALTLTEVINEHARQGWEYLRSESLTAETPGGWFRRTRSAEHTVLVFRQPRETLGPRLVAANGDDAHGPTSERPELKPPLRHEPKMDPVPAPTPEMRAGPEPDASEGSRQPDRSLAGRVQAGLQLRDAAPDTPVAAAAAARGAELAAPTPLRPAPRLGPAERN